MFEHFLLAPLLASARFFCAMPSGRRAVGSCLLLIPFELVILAGLLDGLAPWLAKFFRRSKQKGQIGVGGERGLTEEALPNARGSDLFLRLLTMPS